MTYNDLLKEMSIGNNHLLILGAAGSGKSHLIHRLQEQSNNILYAAPSGIAALNIKGLTLHSLFGLRPVTPQPQVYDLFLNKNRLSLLKNAHTLLIDEISMVSSDLFDKIDIILRKVRDQNTVFGGIRIIMVGDIFQLQPFIKKKSIRFMKRLYPDPAIENYTFFNSKSFNNSLFLESLKVFQLEYDYRHENDHAFGNLLSSVRFGSCEAKDMILLNSRISNEANDYIHLATTTNIANYYNQIKMDELRDIADISTMEKNIITTEERLEKEMYPMNDELSIKIGMKIIFVMNDSTINGRRWVNGTMGKVIHKNNYGIFKTVGIQVNDQIYEVGKELYDVYIPYYNETNNNIESRCIAKVCQFPFIEAWAITIHRSQSLTLDKVHIELGAKVFANGQLYVGLSRVRSLEDLFINRKITMQDIKVSLEIKLFYNNFLEPRMEHVYNLSVKKTERVNNTSEGEDGYDMEWLMQNSVANNFSGWYKEPRIKSNRILLRSDQLSIESEQIICSIEDSNNIAFHESILQEDIDNALEITTPEQEVEIEESAKKARIGKGAREGIDKIKIILNPEYINLENKKRHISPKNMLTLHHSGPFRMLSIHAGGIIDNWDIHISIALALNKLIEFDILNIPFLKSNNCKNRDAVYFIYKNLNLFVANISELEFFFDIRNENINIDEKSVEYDYLIKVIDRKTGATTYYTQDYNSKYNRSSTGIIYNREAKLIKDNQTSYASLSENPYKTRLEFRLINISSDWLHINNLRGTYKDIIKRHLNYLAILYKNYFLNHVNIDSSENRYLEKIIERANVTDKVRYTNPDNTLRKQNPVTREQRSLYKIEEKQRKIDELHSAFLQQIGNHENDRKYTYLAQFWDE